MPIALKPERAVRKLLVENSLRIAERRMPDLYDEWREVKDKDFLGADYILYPKKRLIQQAIVSQIRSLVDVIGESEEQMWFDYLKRARPLLDKALRLRDEVEKVIGPINA